MQCRLRLMVRVADAVVIIWDDRRVEQVLVVILEGEDQQTAVVVIKVDIRTGDEHITD